MPLEPGASDVTTTVDLSDCCRPAACFPGQTPGGPFGDSVCVTVYKRTYAGFPRTEPHTDTLCTEWPPITLSYAGQPFPLCEPDPLWGVYGTLPANAFEAAARTNDYFIFEPRPSRPDIPGTSPPVAVPGLLNRWSPTSHELFISEGVESGGCGSNFQRDCDAGCLTYLFTSAGYSSPCWPYARGGDPCQDSGVVGGFPAVLSDLFVTICPGPCASAYGSPGVDALTPASARVPLPCVHLGDPLTAAERKAAGLAHSIKDWRWCGAGLGPVCRCSGCGPACPLYVADPSGSEL
jgi:hypothetical protein